MAERDVAVVGAGPVGLALALGLARAGRSVLVLEKGPGTSEHSRAPAVWPRTQEVLARLGVLEAFRAEGILLGELEVCDADRGRPLLRLPLGELRGETAFPELLLLPQSSSERLLREAVAREPTARALFSAEVVGLEQARRAVTLRYRRAGRTEEATAAFAVGCDGAHSVVRESLGASFEGLTYPVRAGLADLRLDPDPDLPFPRVSSRRGLALGIRIAPDLWRLILPFAAQDATPLDERIGRAACGLFGRTRYRVVWQSEFALHRRMSSRFAVGRVALAGDAAHLNSPVGGQGMNAGLQDTEHLARTLLEALDRGSPEPLAGYDRRRRAAVAAGVNAFTHRLTRLLLLAEGRLVKPLLAAASLPLRIAPVRRRFLRRLAMLEPSASP